MPYPQDLGGVVPPKQDADPKLEAEQPLTHLGEQSPALSDDQEETDDQDDE